MLGNYTGLINNYSIETCAAIADNCTLGKEISKKIPYIREKIDEIPNTDTLKNYTYCVMYYLDTSDAGQTIDTYIYTAVPTISYKMFKFNLRDLFSTSGVVQSENTGFNLPGGYTYFLYASIIVEYSSHRPNINYQWYYSGGLQSSIGTSAATMASLPSSLVSPACALADFSKVDKRETVPVYLAFTGGDIQAKLRPRYSSCLIFRI